MTIDRSGIAGDGASEQRVSGAGVVLRRSRAVLELTLMLLLITLTIVLLVLAGRAWRAPAPEMARARVPAAAPAPTRRAVAPLPAEPVSVAGAPVEGSPTARAALIEYSDLQCPYCAKFATETQPEIEKQYVGPGRVRIFFRYMPLESIHPMALKAAEAAACAGEQGRFWEMAALTFADQHRLDSASFAERAHTIGLNDPAFQSCLAAGHVDAGIKADLKSGGALGVSGTPTMFLGMVEPDGRVKLAQRLVGAVPFDRIKAALDALLEAIAK